MAEKKTVKKAAKKVAKVSVSKAFTEFEVQVEEMEKKLNSNPMLKLGAIMQSMKLGKEVVVLKYIAELEKKFTSEELEKIAAKVVK